MKEFNSSFLFFLSILFLGTGCFVQAQQHRFFHLGAENSLSNNQITCFLKDSRGFMWIGTGMGLNRYDGHSIRVFRKEVGDSTSLADNSIISLFEDYDGDVWIRTRRGYNLYHRKTERIWGADKIVASRKFGLTDLNFGSVVRSAKGDVFYLLHSQKGLLKYSRATGKISGVAHVPLDSGTIRSTPISDLQEDGSGAIWVVHTDGVVEKLHQTTNRVIWRSDFISKKRQGKATTYRLLLDGDNEPWVYGYNDQVGGWYFNPDAGTVSEVSTRGTVFRLNNNIISGMALDRDGNIWVGTDHGGVNLINKVQKKVSYLLHSPDQPKSISQNSVTSLYVDNEGMVWIGTFKKGVNVYHPQAFRFLLYQQNAENASGLPYSDVNTFVEDAEGNLWIGTDGGGLIHFNRKTGSFRQYRNVPGDPKSLSNDIIVSLCLDRSGILWIGTYFGGLNAFDGNTFRQFRHDPSNPESISDDRVWEVFEDREGRLWVGTLDNGLDVLDRSRMVFGHYQPGQLNSVQSAYISDIMEDRFGDIWIGTSGGVDRLVRKTGKFEHYKIESGLTSNYISTLVEDPSGSIWIGTDNGLNLFDRKSGRFRSFSTSDGLPDNAIMTVALDKSGSVWLGTPKGLVRMEVARSEGVPVEKASIEVFNEQDGLQGRSFNENSVLALKSGELVFGGANGFNIFDPAQIKATDRKRKVVFTDLQIFNKRVEPGQEIEGRVILETSISLTDFIELKYSENVFSVEFTSLNYLYPGKDRFWYKLEGFNDQWFETDNGQGRVTYTNLSPGEYVLKVKEAGGAEESRLKIRINPPLWRTFWAYLFYAMLVVAALVLGRWIILERERMKFRLETERKEAQRLHEFDLMKLRFFTNVSHEFRTPLSLILAPIENLLNTVADVSLRSQLSMISRNANQLLQLVTQLLEFKRLEVEEVEFSPSSGNMIEFLREITHTFSELAGSRSIHLGFESNVEVLNCSFDQEKFTRIMYNLLSNAFKFTPEKGSVNVGITLKQNIAAVGAESLGDGEVVEIVVTDTGIGIPAAALSRVFDRFFQHKTPDSVVNPGSGIGLSLVKEYVKMHGGEVTAESTEGVGSTFRILLPVRKVDGQELNASTGVAEKENVVQPFESNEEMEHRTPGLPTLLIVEDNEDFRLYLEQSFSAEFDVYQAVNGKEGLERALQLNPDLIISDVMMPEMNGLEMCRLVKEDSRISHVPIILLTARSAEQQQLQGYESGADAYVSKPFKVSLLQAQARNLIRQKERFRQQFQQHVRTRAEIPVTEVKLVSADEQFLAKAVKVVEDNLQSTEFSVEILSGEMSMSRAYLYKKLVALTGKTPIEFIRFIRMGRAAQLLERGKLRVSEVAWQTGFPDAKQFAKYFREEYGTLPSEYRKRDAEPEL